MSSGAERGLVFVDDFRDGNVINSSSDLLDSGSGRILASRNLLLLKEKNGDIFRVLPFRLLMILTNRLYFSWSTLLCTIKVTS